MRKYKFVFGTKELNMQIPASIAIHRERKTLYRALSAVGFLGLLFYLLSVPILAVYDATFLEVQLVQYTVVVAVFLLMISLGLTMLAGSKILIDPPLLMTALLFALLVIGAYLMASTNIRNTFGITGIKYLAGSLVMSFLGIYYFGILLINTRFKLKLLEYALLLVPMLFALFYIINYQNIITPLRLISLFIPVFILAMCYLPGRKAKLFAGVGLILALISSVESGFALATSLPVVVSLLAVLVIMVFVWRGQLLKDSKEMLLQVGVVVRGKRSLPRLNKAVAFWLILLFTLIYLAVSVSWNMSHAVSLASFFNPLGQDLQLTLNSLTSIFTVVVGNGAIASLRQTTAADIIEFQGVLGAFSYLLLGLSVIYLFARKLRHYLLQSKSGMNQQFIFLPLVVGIAFAGLISVVNQLEVTVWWFCFTLLGAEILLAQRNLITKLLDVLRLRNFELTKRVALVQVVVLVLLAVLFFYLLSMLGLQVSKGLL